MRKELSLHWLLLSVSHSVLTLLIPLYLAAEGVAEKEIGFMLGAGSLLSLLIIVFVVSSSDRTGRRFSLMVFGFFAALAAGIIIAFPLYPAYILAIALLGASDRSALVLGKIISIESFPGEKGKTYGILSAAMSAGDFLGKLLAGNATEIWGFTAAFYASLFIAMAALLPLLKLNIPRPAEKDGAGKPAVYVGFLAQRMLTSASFSVAFSFAYSLYLRNHFSLPYAYIGAITAMGSLANIAGLSLGRMSDNRDPLRISNLSVVIASLSISSLFFTHGVAPVVLAYLISQLMVGLASTALPHFFGRVARNLGKDVGMIDAAGGTLGAALGSVIAGFLVAGAGYGAAFLASGVLLLSSAALLHALFRKK